MQTIIITPDEHGRDQYGYEIINHAGKIVERWEAVSDDLEEARREADESARTHAAKALEDALCDQLAEHYADTARAVEVMPGIIEYQDDRYDATVNPNARQNIAMLAADLADPEAIEVVLDGEDPAEVAAEIVDELADFEDQYR